MKIRISLLFLLLVSTANADYSISWHTIDDGGGQSSGGSYTLTGTIGQPDADWAGGGSYELLGGFWPGGPLCIVDFDDLGRFCEYWLDTGAGIAADLDDSNNVDFVDYSIFSDYWRYYCPADWLLK